MKQETADNMKPIMILPPDAVNAEDIKRLNDNGLCVIVAKDPSAVKFVDPIPSAVQRTKVEQAAIALSRKLLDRNMCPWSDELRAKISSMYVELLVRGTPLDPAPTQQEQERQIFDVAKADELRRLAREEAKEGRRKAREEAAKKKGT